MKKNIALYKDGHASTYVLSERLRETFQHAAVDIVEITQDDVLQGLYPNDNTIAFILPGTPGGSSVYREQLGEHGFAAIRHRVENGMSYLGFCAGAYLGATDFRFYYKHTGEIREIATPLPLIEGHAKGPIEEYSNFRELHNPYADYSLAMIDFVNTSGEMDEAGVHYSLGPSIELYPDATGHYDILARFKEVAGQPIAAIRRNNIGLGDATLVSFPPEIGDINMRWINPESPYKQSGYEMVNRLHPWTDSRKRFWNSLMKPLLQKLEVHYV